jgi:beta-barrel assembly-enhancing protease
MMLKRAFLGLVLSCSVFAVAQEKKEVETLTIDAKHQKDIDEDIKEGEEFSKTVEKTEKLSKNEAMLARLQKVGGIMAELANKTHLTARWGDKRYSKFNYDFKLLEGKDNVNAFSLPGGRIYVYEGLINFIQSDDELAAVMGHEISHAALRHVDALKREAAKGQLLAIPAILATIFAGSRAGMVLPAVQLTQQSTMSGWSQKAEHAADFSGFELMLKSPYNPTAVLTVSERLAQMEKSKPQYSIGWGIFTTHPPSQERVTAILKDMKAAHVPVQRSAVTTSYSTILKKVDGGIEAWFGAKLLYTFSGEDAQARAENAQKRLNSFFDSVPAMYDVKAQGDQIMGIDKVLILIDPADVAREKVSVPQLASKTVTSIQSALYSLAYNVLAPGVP